MFEPTGEFCKIFKNCGDVVNRNKRNWQQHYFWHQCCHMIIELFSEKYVNDSDLLTTGNGSFGPPHFYQVNYN